MNPCHIEARAVHASPQPVLLFNIQYAPAPLNSWSFLVSLTVQSNRILFCIWYFPFDPLGFFPDLIALSCQISASTHHTQSRHKHLSVPVPLQVYAFPQSSHLLAAQPDLLERQTREHASSFSAEVSVGKFYICLMRTLDTIFTTFLYWLVPTFEGFEDFPIHQDLGTRGMRRQ